LTPPPVVQTPRSAVVIVLSGGTRDPGESLRRCLTAIGKLSSVIVVDSGSGETAGMEQQFPYVRYIRLPRHFGLTKALNLGIRAAETEFVLLLSPEVEISGGAIDRLADKLDEQTNVGAVAPRLLLPDGTPAAQVRDLPTASQPDPPQRSAQAGDTVPAVTVQAVMFRMFFLRALRDIDERYGDYGSAIELSQQVRRANKTILIHPEVTAIVHEQAVKPTNEEQADREVGTANFLRKHHGFLSGVFYWLGRVFTALGSFQFGKLASLASWKKIDGN
jgi:GT2 family glycosyltransferase